LFATGSVAAVKVPELAAALAVLAGSPAQVKVVASAPGMTMLAKARDYDRKAWDAFQALGVQVLTDRDEWEGYRDIRKDLVVHIG
jgi:hypothetical protein